MPVHVNIMTSLVVKDESLKYDIKKPQRTRVKDGANNRSKTVAPTVTEKDSSKEPKFKIGDIKDSLNSVALSRLHGRDRRRFLQSMIEAKSENPTKVVVKTPLLCAPDKIRRAVQKHREMQVSKEQMSMKEAGIVGSSSSRTMSNVGKSFGAKHFRKVKRSFSGGTITKSANAPGKITSSGVMRFRKKDFDLVKTRNK